MSFRDDHEATLVRAEAVTRELERTRERLAVTIAERAELMGEVMRLRMLVPVPKPPRPPRKPRRTHWELTWRDWVLGLAVGFVPVLVMLAIIGAASP